MVEIELHEERSFMNKFTWVALTVSTVAILSTIWIVAVLTGAQK
jgi:hypothetical protein